MPSTVTHTRVPDDEIETRIFIRRTSLRPTPETWDREVVAKIMRELDPRSRLSPRAIIRYAGASAEQNVFLVPSPPSSGPPAPWAAPPLLRDTPRPRRARRRRSILPWITFAMTFAISYGVMNDPALRHETASEIQSSAMRLYRFVSRIRT